MTQPTLPNRKRPGFVRCPVCGTEFTLSRSQRWCSRDCAKRDAMGASLGRLIVLTPEGRFQSMSGAARHHNVTRATVRRRIREGCPGWQFEKPIRSRLGSSPATGPGAGGVSGRTGHDQGPPG